MKKKLLTLGCVTVLCASMAVGCGNQDSSDTSNQSVSSVQDEERGRGAGKPEDDGSKMVQITKIEDNTFTASVGEDMHGGPNGNDQGEPPENGEAPKDGEPPADGKEAGEGKEPKGDGEGMQFNATGETITFTVTDATEIKKGGRDSQEDGSLSDITENMILRVNLNDNNEATSIMIMQGE